MDRLNTPEFNNEIERVKSKISKHSMETNSFLEVMHPVQYQQPIYTYKGLCLLPNSIGVTSVTRISQR